RRGVAGRFLPTGRTTMRNTWILGAAALALLAASAAVRSDEPKKAADPAKAGDLFNGKTLDGWEGLPEYWSVKDGAIVGAYTNKGLTHNTFLWSKNKYK